MKNDCPCGTHGTETPKTARRHGHVCRRKGNQKDASLTTLPYTGAHAHTQQYLDKELHSEQRGEQRLRVAADAIADAGGWTHRVLDRQDDGVQDDDGQHNAVKHLRGERRGWRMEGGGVEANGVKTATSPCEFATNRWVGEGRQTTTPNPKPHPHPMGA